MSNTPGNLNFGFDALTQQLTLNGQLVLGGIAGPFQSPLGAGIIYFDKVSKLLKASEDGGAPVNLLTGGGGGSAYEFLQNGSTLVAQENILNTGTTLHAADDATNHRTVLNVLDNTSVQRIAVDKNGTNVGTRKAINLIEGTNVSMTLADNNGADRVDITVNAAGSGLSGSGSSGEVTFWDGSSSLTGDTNLQWDNTQKFLGIGGAPSNQLNAVLALTNLSTDTTQCSIETDINPTMNSGNTMNVLYSVFDLAPTSSNNFGTVNTIVATPIHEGTGTIGTINGVNVAIENNSSDGSGGIITTAVGYWAQLLNQGTGQMTNATSFLSAITNNSTGHIENLIGMDLEAPRNGGGGTLQNAFGLVIRDHSAIAVGGTQANLFSLGTNSKNIFQGEILLSASTTGRAPINFPSGTAPTSPVDGDLWYDSSLRFRKSATTYNLLTSTSSTSAYTNVQSHGGAVAQETTLNFLHSLSAADNGGNSSTDVDISTSPASATTVVGTGRLVSSGTGLSGGGDLSADRTLSLANTAVTPGSYTSTNLTVDAQGRITAASNGSGGGITPSYASVYTSSNITVPGAGNVTIAWNHHDLDTSSYHDDVTDNTRLTAPATGVYEVILNPHMSGNAVDTFTFKIFINGNIASLFGRNGAFQVDSNTSGNDTAESFSIIGSLNSGDYIEANAARTSAAGTVTLNANSVFQINRIA